MKRKTIYLLAAILIFLCSSYNNDRKANEPLIIAEVDFTTKLRGWDGFGVNYVEMAQSIDPVKDPQEYGGGQLLAFASNGSKYPDAFVVLNLSETMERVEVSVKSNTTGSFNAFRSSKTEQYHEAGAFSLKEGKLLYDCPAGSVTTFFGQ